MTNEEMILKAKGAKSPEDIVKLAKAEGKSVSLDKAREIFDTLNKKGEVSDDELDAAVGGCGGYTPPEVIRMECLTGKNNRNGRAYWKCKICGSQVITSTHEIVVTEANKNIVCEHALQFKTLNCDNCGYLMGDYCPQLNWSIFDPHVKR